MTTLLALAGSLGTAGLVYMLVILGRLSKRIGAVIKMPPLYRWQFVASGLVTFATAVSIIRVAVLADPATAPEWALTPALYLWLYHVPLALGASMGLATAWPYWSWLLREG